ncbi:zinc finger protein family memeber [Trypanosoma grayi]|uniref:zinc finger protein family memeber n=1 Tax=Trypanosoma grayi TaxID=71804 RepID=UPI0004F46DD0|nr:zinc finger protein family memeber [Trypanosoma grayi]KEG08556.1 zinc finger protein family memeber [Trypanosoma grayi]
MCTPNGSGFHGDAMYQAHFGDRGIGDGCAGGGGGAQSRFFGQAASSPTGAMTGSASNFSQCVYMVCANGMPSPMSFAPQNAVPVGVPVQPAPCSPTSAAVNTLPQQPQQQTAFMVNLVDGQSVPCVPVQQVLLATPGPMPPSPMLTGGGGGFQRVRSSCSVNLQSEGGPGDSKEGSLSPLPPGQMNGKQIKITSPTLPSVVSPTGLHSMQMSSFAHHFSLSQMTQGGGSRLSDEVSSSRNNNNGGAGGEPRVDVYAPDFTSVISLPASAIVHQPPPSLGVSRLVLCRKYIPGRPDSCWKGDMCKFVHADPSGAPRSQIHVNYVWRSVERCTYPHLPPGEKIVVLAPNGRQPAETFSSERILVTRGSLNRKSHVGPLSRCAHYYFNRLCNRGENCNFIHTLHIDPNVEVDFKRAPASTSIAPIKKREPRSKGHGSGGNHDHEAGNTPAQNCSDTLAPQQSMGLSAGLSGGSDPTSSGVSPPSQAFYLVVPQNATRSLSRSLSSVGGGSEHSMSGATNPLEWSFVDNLEGSVWSDGDITPQL